MYWRLDSRARGNMCPLGTCAGVPLQGNSPEDSQKQTPSELRRRNAFPIPRVANLLGASERAPRPEDGDHEEADTLDHSSLLHGADFRGAEPPTGPPPSSLHHRSPTRPDPRPPSTHPCSGLHANDKTHHSYMHNTGLHPTSVILRPHNLFREQLKVLLL
jgi:hypothetical protein